MTEKTRALVVPAIHQVELRHIEVPSLQSGEVRIRALHTLLSMGTEISIATGQRMENARFPFVPGYQGVGQIEACADGVKGFREGDIVLFKGGRVLPPHHAVWGAHQAVVVCSTYGLFRCPGELHPRIACLATLFGVGMHGVELAEVKPTDVVVVIGHGLIGAGAAQAARARGALVIVSEPNAARRRLAAENAADVVVDPTSEKVEEVLRAHLQPDVDGADVVIESTGVGALLDGAMRLARTKGRFVYQGWYSGNVSHYFMVPHAKELTAFYPTGLAGPYQEGAAGLRHSQMKEAAVRLAARGIFRVEPYLSHVMSPSQIVEGYQLAMSDRRHEIVGMIFDW